MSKPPAFGLYGQKIPSELQADARASLAFVRMGRAEHDPGVRGIAKTPEVVTAWNITGEGRRELETAAVDVAHLDAAVSGPCRLAQTSASIILKSVREHQPTLPVPRNP